MSKSEALKKIKEILKLMEATEIEFPATPEDSIVAHFNCKELTSFREDLPGWEYSGIKLDPTQSRQYVIEFRKKLA